MSPPSFLARSFAYAIDCVCSFVFVVTTQLALMVPLRNVLGISDDWFHSGINTQLYTIATISIPIWLYFSLLGCSHWQGTIGQRVMGLRVKELSTDARIGFAKSFLRTIVKLLPWEMAHLGNNLPTPVWYAEDPGFRIAFATSGLLLAAYIASMYTNPRRRCIHDLIAGTKIEKQLPT